MKKTLSTAIIISALLVSTVVGVQVVKADSKTITVPDHYSTIQEAIDAAAEGDTVFVKSGVYTGNLNINKSLTLIGNNRDTTRIVGDQTGTTLLINHGNVSITGFTIQSPEISLLIWNRKRGIHLLDVSNCNVSGNNILRNDYHAGIWLYGASGNTITGNKVEGGDSGIKLESSSNNIITYNSVLGNREGISLHGSNLNIFHTNFLMNNTYGVVISESNSNSFYANNITSYDHGVLIGKPGDYVTHVTNNTFHHNNFVNNAVNFGTYLVVVGVNYFDDGKEGNYYSDYRGEDNNGDGIGDTAWIMDSSNTDHYPLMKPVNTGKVLDPNPPVITIISPANSTYSSNFVLMTFSVNEPVLGLNLSSDGAANTTITGNTTLTGLSEGSHSIIVYANDTAGNMGKSDIVFFTIATATPSQSPSSSPTQQPTATPTQTPHPHGTAPPLNYGFTESTLFVAVILFATIAPSIAIGVIVYRRRRKG